MNYVMNIELSCVKLMIICKILLMNTNHIKTQTFIGKADAKYK